MEGVERAPDTERVHQATGTYSVLALLAGMLLMIQGLGGLAVIGLRVIAEAFSLVESGRFRPLPWTAFVGMAAFGLVQCAWGFGVAGRRHTSFGGVVVWVLLAMLVVALGWTPIGVIRWINVAMGVVLLVAAGRVASLILHAGMAEEGHSKRVRRMKRRARHM